MYFSIDLRYSNIKFNIYLQFFSPNYPTPYQKLENYFFKFEKSQFSQKYNLQNGKYYICN